MDESVISQILGISLGALLVILVIAVLVYVILMIRFNKKSNQRKDENEINVDTKPIEDQKDKKSKEKQGVQYTKQSIFDFM